MNAFYTRGRCVVKPFLMHTIDTGTVSKKAYGVHIRAVNVTRGNRQGNNAFNETIAQGGFYIPTASSPDQLWSDSDSAIYCKLWQEMDH